VMVTGTVTGTKLDTVETDVKIEVLNRVKVLTWVIVVVCVRMLSRNTLLVCVIALVIVV
jgi:hypothetical protein